MGKTITTFLVVISSLEQIITTSKHETMNMRALDIQQSLLIHCLSIDYITGSVEERARNKESGNIILNVKNVFTSEYKSI